MEKLPVISGGYDNIQVQVRFSVKSTYHPKIQESYLVASSSIVVSTKAWENLWNTLLYVRNFLWENVHNKLPVGGNLLKNKAGINNICHMCGEHNETIEHFFFKCDFARAIWYGTMLSFIMDNREHASFMSRW